MGTHLNINGRRAEINNEIVLLRKFVRQARVCVSRKLCRHAKLLRAKRGNEKQCERNTKTANKLIDEVLTLKGIKDDDVSVFGITNRKSLQNILQDASSDLRIKILAKVTHYKSLRNKILEFKTKYPDYENICKRSKKKQNAKKQPSMDPVTSGTRMKAVQKDIHAQEVKHEKMFDNRNKVKNRKDGMSNQIAQTDDSEDCNVNDDDDDGKDEGEGDEPGDNSDNNVDSNDIGKKSKNERSISIQCLAGMETTVQPLAENRILLEGRYNEETNLTHGETCVKTVSDIAVVKRFDKLLESGACSVKSTSLTRSNRCTDAIHRDASENTKKESDDFFITCDENKAYLSVVVSKPDKNVHDVDENDRSINKGMKIESGLWNSVRTTEDFNPTKRIMHDRGVKNERYLLGKKFIEKQNWNMLSKNAPRMKETHIYDKEKLHPSWEARRKRQEIMKQGFQGKKIVFDDI